MSYEIPTSTMQEILLCCEECEHFENGWRDGGACFECSCGVDDPSNFEEKTDEG
jgi:hypothetical protein